ncbi:hypothetical protein X943_000641 [Babesia divergens]|uniref:RNA polymerase Rpb7-like N-terminal domain-containing protein n=1 Tax=Babesia divergens TaxID=32595 RepID=A0AAD9GJA8_BABDI|nr:hypothetical protein X943_000641 [Babesia divergens]
MAQLPWAVVESRPVTFAKARLAAVKCAQELSEVLDNNATKSRVVSLLQDFIGALQECEANATIKEQIKHVPCVSLVKARGAVQIHPSFMGDALKGVYSYLANLLMQYNEDLGGIWLTCGKVRQMDECGYVTDGDSFGILSLRISLRLLVFTPRSGRMCGKVTKADPHRASLLVYGIFGVTARPDENDNLQAQELREGDTVDMEVSDVKILPKNKWVILSTTMGRVRVMS